MKRAMTFRPAVFSCTFSSTNRTHVFHTPTNCARNIRFMIFVQVEFIRFVSSTHSSQPSKA